MLSRWSHTIAPSRAWMQGAAARGPSALLLPLWLLLLLLAVGHLQPASAGPREELQLGMRLLREKYPNHSWSEPVIVSDEPRGSTDRSEAPVIFRKVLVDQDQVGRSPTVCTCWHTVPTTSSLSTSRPQWPHPPRHLHSAVCPDGHQHPTGPTSWTHQPARNRAALQPCTSADLHPCKPATLQASNHAPLHPPQAQLYRENLMLDLAPWRERRNLSMAALATWATGLPPKSSVRLVLVKQGRVALLGQQGAPAVSYECVHPCDRIMESTLDGG